MNEEHSVLGFAVSNFGVKEETESIESLVRICGEERLREPMTSNDETAVECIYTYILLFSDTSRVQKYVHVFMCRKLCTLPTELTPSLVTEDVQ